MPEPVAIVSARPRITVNGERRADLDDAVLEAAIVLPLAGQSSAELNLQNWGPSDSGNGEPDFRFTELGFGDELQIHMSEEGEDAVFSGQITGIEERYGEGAPHLIILAEDALHRLARQRHSRSFEDKSLDELVQELADEAGLDTDINIGDASGQWLQLNESNLALLQRLLTPLAIWPRLENGVLRAKPEEPDAQPVIVSAQDNALQVRIIADLNRQPKEVKVRAYDPASDESVEASSTDPGGNPGGTTALDELQTLGWEGDSLFTQPYADNQGYAELLAKGRFKFLGGRFLHGDVVCKGNPQLRSGKPLELRDVSARMAGTYRIAQCSHRFDSHKGYETRMKVNRADWEAGA
jgi:phage protein D